jgi:hypothetical protein
VLTKVVRTDFHLQADPNVSPPFFIVNESETVTYFRSKAVIMACGAYQFLSKEKIKTDVS